MSELLSETGNGRRGPKFDPTFNWGHIFIVLGLVINLLVMTATVVGAWTTVKSSLDSVQTQVSALTASLTDRSKEIADVKAESDLNSYQIKTMGDVQAKQDSKLDQILSNVGEVQRDIAVIKAQNGQKP